ncbi:MAG: STAS domain-containing protein [Stomatobaculum sp.]|nr:STAS domain-containing protein [Stomatobaculum sp.]
MEIIRTLNGTELTIAPVDRLDAITAPEFDEVLQSYINDVTDITFDFGKLVYISSAGLRVLLAAQQAMEDKDGTMELINVNRNIMEVLDITGLSSILTIN